MTTTHAPVHTIGFEINDGPGSTELSTLASQGATLKTTLCGTAHAPDGVSQYMAYDAHIVHAEVMQGKPDTFTITVSIENFKPCKGIYNAKNRKNWLNLEHSN